MKACKSGREYSHDARIGFSACVACVWSGQLVCSQTMTGFL
jgi:hypothetical protein